MLEIATKLLLLLCYHLLAQINRMFIGQRQEREAIANYFNHWLRIGLRWRASIIQQARRIDRPFLGVGSKRFVPVDSAA